MNQIHGRRLQATAGLLAGAVGATSLTLALAHLTVDGARRGGAVRVEDLVALVITGTGTAVSAWLAASTGIALLCVLTRIAGSSWRAGEAAVHRLAPTIVRRALAVTVTTGLGLSLATGAHAAAPSPTPAGPTGVATAEATAPSLGWTPTAGATDPAAPADTLWRPTGTSAVTATVPAPGPTTVSRVTAQQPAPLAATAEATQPPTTVVVQAGDSLWDIAARHLPAGAGDADIASAWPQWYKANRDVIGDDPDQLQPAQVLHAPTTAAAATPDSPTPAQTEVPR
ncbi:LysM peptidoglycan-binding domain-containing protein [Cellulomonas soli]|uniref:LysM peptidoglycan-binding domain-containing protein n=1 Tax=Cellulomonas soli TaxID=931535 RepID=UPI003F8351CD